MMFNLRAIKVFLLTLTVTACSSSGDNRYRDTELLERPPILDVEKQPGYEETEVDDSVVPKKPHKKGLGDDVYLIASKPPQLKIKQPLKTAWHTLGLALKQSEIKITDQEQDNGLYYVAYSPKTLLDVMPFSSHEAKETIFMLKLTADGEETKITSSIASAAEQSSLFANTDPDDEDNRIDAEDLLMLVFKTLRDDLTEE